MAIALQTGGAGLDLSSRLFHTATVVASPAAAAETIVASVTITSDVALTKGVVLAAFGAFTVGASGVSVNLRIRRTDVSGTVVKATGAVTYTAADLGALSLQAVDTGITPLNQVYVLTATVASGAAESAFSAVTLSAIVI